MGAVFELSQWRERETRKLLDLIEQQLSCGNLQGLAIQARDLRGNETFHLTGCYKRNPGFAAAAGLRMSVRMALAEHGFTRN